MAKYDLCIIGGAGHVGLPLGVAFAVKGVKVALYDIDRDSLKKISSGVFPFREKGGDEALKKALKRKTLFTVDTANAISQSEAVLLVIGTPVDEYLNPDVNGFMRVVDKYLPYFKNGQTLILRSTVYPGTSERLEHYFKDRGKKVHVAFCPERIVQGRALEELGKISQIISAFDPKALEVSQRLFRKITPKIVVAKHPVEAELAKLFSNSWRYIKFAVANQFFMIAEEHNLDYHGIYEAMCRDYPRNRDLPAPGFAAGPCLFKDTMQLAAFNNNNFFLGHSAMLVNEGLPNFIVQKLKRKMASGHSAPVADSKVVPGDKNAASRIMADLNLHTDLKSKTVGILGMAFKAESDDPRDSLSYKLRKIARAEAKAVLCHDPYIKDSTFTTLEKLVAGSDVLILAAPHKEYRKIDPQKYPDKVFIDIWDFFPKK